MIQSTRIANISNQTRYYKQWLNLAILLLMVLLIVFILLNTKKPKQAHLKKINQTKSFITAHDIFNDRNILLHDIKTAQKKTQSTIKQLQKHLTILEETRLSNTSETLEKKIALLEEKIFSLDKNFQNNEAMIFETLKQRNEKNPQKNNLAKKDLIHPVKVTLHPNTMQTADHYIPAGTHVRATVIGAIDASAGVSAQVDQKPLLLRITDLAVLPNYQQYDLIGCTVIAEAYGDISSERVFARLKTLSCVLRSGQVLERSVRGNLFGPNGKYGIHGRVVRREKNILAHAAAYGLISGLSSGLSQSFSTQSVSALGSTQTVHDPDMLKYAVSNGTGHALNKLADYHIKRAEQYQAVIQIDAGVSVDIVFTSGFSTRFEESPVMDKTNEHEKTPSDQVQDKALTEILSQ